eukprot:scaffold1564_cov78-Skeletonema_dohrnii-CCMP3373.AAC.2
MTTFECDLCHFRNLNKRDPEYTSGKDRLTMTAIRRANLDAFWARESSTLKGNLDRVIADYRDTNHRFNIGENFLPVLGNPTSSWRKGRYTRNVQFGTVRQTRSWYANIFDAAANPVEGDDEEEATGLSPTKSQWFKRFMRGVKLRMGVVRIQNEALTSQQVLGLLELISEEWIATEESTGKERLEELACYVLIGFGVGLRGEEVLLVSLEGLLYFWEETGAEAQPYTMITLFGRFKAETGYRWHCLPLCENGRSGIPFRAWIGALLERRVSQGRRKDYLFSKRDGSKASVSDFDGEFKRLIALLHEHEVRPELSSRGTDLEQYSLRRSLRRGAILETTERVDESIVKSLNRWRTRESARGTEPVQSKMHNRENFAFAFAQSRGRVRVHVCYGDSIPIKRIVWSLDLDLESGVRSRWQRSGQWRGWRWSGQWSWCWWAAELLTGYTEERERGKDGADK